MIMKQLKRYAVTGIIFVLITGSLAHFLYDWTGNNPVVGLFTPVNESIWEHMKLLFFPMLLYLLFILYKFNENRSCLVPASCLSLLAGTFLIPLCYYAYTSLLGKAIFLLDIGTFIFSTLTAFWLFYRLSLSCRLKPYKNLLVFLVCILFACFLFFTYRAPALQIFQDPAVSSHFTFSSKSTTSPSSSRVVP